VRQQIRPVWLVHSSPSLLLLHSLPYLCAAVLVWVEWMVDAWSEGEDEVEVDEWMNE